MSKQPEALIERLLSDNRTGWLNPRNLIDAATEIRRLHEVNQELLEAAQKVLSNKRGEGDWLILSTYCEDLEAAIAKAEGEKK